MRTKKMSEKIYPVFDSSDKLYEYLSDTFQRDDTQLRNLSDILLVVMKYVPNFHMLMYYYMFDVDNLQSVPVILNRLQKRGYIKSLVPSTKDVNIRKLYYITPIGYEKAGQFSNISLSNTDKFLKNHSAKNAFHDFGVGFLLLALMYSPAFSVQSIDYEYAFSLDQRIVSKERRMIRAHRPDAVLSLTLTQTAFLKEPFASTVYVEEDIGTEPIKTLLAKLDEYVLHDIFSYDYKNEPFHGFDMIVFASLKPITDKPMCFNRNAILRLVAALGEMDINTYSSALPPKDSMAKLCSLLKKYTPAFSECWGKEEFQSYLDRLASLTDVSYLSWLRTEQRSLAMKRFYQLSEMLCDAITDFYNKQSFAQVRDVLFHACIDGGYHIPYIANCDYMEMLSFLYLPAHDKRLLKVVSILQPYFSTGVSFKAVYGDVKSVSGDYLLRLSNEFQVAGSSCRIFLEYGYDIGAIIRLRSLFYHMATKFDSHFLVFIAVSSFHDAKMIGKLIEPEHCLYSGMDHFPMRNFFVYFLDLEHASIYSISRDGTATVPVKPYGMR